MRVGAAPGSANDASKVNVVLKSGGASPSLPRDTSHQGGWDFLPGDMQIRLYGAACTTVRADAQAKVNVVVGCMTTGH